VNGPEALPPGRLSFFRTGFFPAIRFLPAVEVEGLSVIARPFEQLLFLTCHKSINVHLALCPSPSKAFVLTPLPPSFVQGSVSICQDFFCEFGPLISASFSLSVVMTFFPSPLEKCTPDQPRV